MPFWSTTIAIMFLAAVATGATISRRGYQGSKRHWLFETIAGDRENPFSALSAGTEAHDECNECGAKLDSLSEEFCVSCGVDIIADD